MKLIEISKKQFDDFGFSSRNKNFYQTSQYGTLMARHGFNDLYIALIDDNSNILASSLILIQNIFSSFKFAYSPRGFLIDFYDFNLVKQYTNLLKEYLNKKGVLYLKIDPYITHIERDIKGNINNTNKNSLSIIENLKNIGYEHTGFNLYFENLKPRWNAVIKNEMSSAKLFESFDKKTRNKIRGAEKKGIEIYKGTKDDIKLFFSLIDKKHTRKLDYYYDYFELFGKFDMFDIYFAKINPTEYLKNSRTLYEDEMRINAEISESMQDNINNIGFTNKKMESDKLLYKYKNNFLYANKLFQSNQKEIVVATTAIIKYNKEIFFLIDGINSKFREFNANYLLKWKVIEEFSKKGYLYFHLNGITGDFNPKNKYYGLYDFKTGFNANVVEYIGEFNIIINKLNFRAYKNIKALESILKPSLKKN